MVGVRVELPLLLPRTARQLSVDTAYDPFSNPWSLTEELETIFKGLLFLTQQTGLLVWSLLVHFVPFRVWPLLNKKQQQSIHFQTDIVTDIQTNASIELVLQGSPLSAAFSLI